MFPTGTKFCDADGSRLVSPDKLIPRCVKCGREYPADTKFCPIDGGKVVPEALRNSTDGIANRIKEIISSFAKNVDVEKLINSKATGIIYLVLAILAALIDLYIIMSFFSSGAMQIGGMFTGKFNMFLLYLRYGCMGWIITAIVLSGLAKFIGEVLVDDDDKMGEVGSKIAGYAGGLAILFLLAGIFAKFIVGF
jgi:uncharacterized membrane protein YeaQ/YmgE (transglycosylase-associated protein family)